jgi:hypothetical protein
MSDVEPTPFTTKIYRGAKRIIAFRIVDTTGVPIDITGRTYIFTMRKTELQADPPSFQVECVNDADQVGAGKGLTRAILSRAQTLGFSAVEYVASVFRPIPGDEDVYGIGVVTVFNSIYDKGKA